MFIQVIIFLLWWFNKTDAFLPKIPPPISFSIFTTMGTDLERIISSKAVLSSLITNLRKEITVERIFIEVSEINSNPTNYIYLSIVLSFIYGQWKFYNGTQNKIQKFKKIDTYTKIERVTKDILFIILFAFMKDVQSAS